MSRRLLALVLALAAAAFLASGRRGRRGEAARNGGRERTERLRLEIEQARDRLRAEIARTRGQS
ncbi:MAG TPA: hypothetical protein VHF23_02020 [Gaiellaceae bacterium]|nr:hypothetical protein [Gaiellaceae bacterium]